MINSYIGMLDLNRKLLPCRKTKQRKSGDFFWRFVDSRIVETCDELDLLWNLMKFKFDTDWRCCSVLFAKWLKANAIRESTKNEPNIIISIFVFNQDLTDIEYDYYHSMFSQLFLKTVPIRIATVDLCRLCRVGCIRTACAVSAPCSLAPRAQRRLATVLAWCACMVP